MQKSINMIGIVDNIIYERRLLSGRYFHWRSQPEPHKWSLNLVVDLGSRFSNGVKAGAD